MRSMLKTQSLSSFSYFLYMIYKDLLFPLYMFNSTKKKVSYLTIVYFIFLQHALTKTTMALCRTFWMLDWERENKNRRNESRVRSAKKQNLRKIDLFSICTYDNFKVGSTLYIIHCLTKQNISESQRKHILYFTFLQIGLSAAYVRCVCVHMAHPLPD